MAIAAAVTQPSPPLNTNITKKIDCVSVTHRDSTVTLLAWYDAVHTLRQTSSVALAVYRYVANATLLVCIVWQRKLRLVNTSQEDFLLFFFLFFFFLIRLLPL